MQLARDLKDVSGKKIGERKRRRRSGERESSGASRALLVVNVSAQYHRAEFEGVLISYVGQGSSELVQVVEIDKRQERRAAEACVACDRDGRKTGTELVEIRVLNSELVAQVCPVVQRERSIVDAAVPCR